MIRQFHLPRDRDLEGSQRSQELAIALAAKTDPDTLEKLVELKSLLDSLGGQAFIYAFRKKYQTVTVERELEDGSTAPEIVRVPVEPSEPGSYETVGYGIHYEHIAKAVRNQDREPDAKLPAEPPDDLWDTQQAEVDALDEELEPAAKD